MGRGDGGWQWIATRCGDEFFSFRLLSLRWQTHKRVKCGPCPIAVCNFLSQRVWRGSRYAFSRSHTTRPHPHARYASYALPPRLQMLADHVSGASGGAAPNARYIYLLYMTLGQYSKAAGVALEIAQTDQELGTAWEREGARLGWKQRQAAAQTIVGSPSITSMPNRSSLLPQTPLPLYLLYSRSTVIHPHSLHALTPRTHALTPRTHSTHARTHSTHARALRQVQAGAQGSV